MTTKAASVPFAQERRPKLTSTGPAALLSGVVVEEPQVSGYYDEASGTWSNRKYECAASKKHNETH